MARTVYARVSKVDRNGMKGEVETAHGEVFSFESTETFTLGDPVQIAIEKGTIVTEIVRMGKAYGRKLHEASGREPYWKPGKYR